jgi:hypothetical protein
MLGHLMAVGAQTASACAAVVGASPSNCSYHLRELARFGLVERVGPGGTGRCERAAGGDGRDRPWRPTATGLHYGRPDGEASTPVEAAVQRRLVHAGIDQDASLAHAAVDAHDTQPADWQAAETLSTFGLNVTATELSTLAAAVDAILRPYILLTRENAPAGAAPVHVVFEAFRRPLGPAA